MVFSCVADIGRNNGHCSVAGYGNLRYEKYTMAGVCRVVFCSYCYTMDVVLPGV